MILILSISFCCTGGIIIITYESMATQSKWPVGKLFRKGWFYVFGGLSIIGSIWASFSYFSWIGLTVLPISWIVAAILTFTLKNKTQYISLLLILISWILQFYIKAM